MFRFTIRDVLWLTVVVGLLVGHFVTLRGHPMTTLEMLRQEEAAHAENVRVLQAMIEEKDEELQELQGLGRDMNRYAARRKLAPVSVETKVAELCLH